LSEWYYAATSEWTLDYPPFFAYFEWLLSQVAKYVDSNMLLINHLNYASWQTKYFQRMTVIIMDLFYAISIKKCISATDIKANTHKNFVAESMLLLNVGLFFVDHIHFQYNGFLFGILLFSIGYILEERYLLGAFCFSILLNFKHIFLYIAPSFAIYLLKYYVLENSRNKILSLINLVAVGTLPILLSLGPFWKHLPQVRI